MALNPYLNFPGNTAEAMAHYRDVLGGELKIFTFGDFGMKDMPADGTMHASLVGDGFALMASDSMPGAEETWGGTRVYLLLTDSDAELMRTRFAALAEGGSVGMPLERQVWGDEFGIEWMITIPESE